MFSGTGAFFVFFHRACGKPNHVVLIYSIISYVEISAKQEDKRMSESEWRARGKECSPAETVARAGRILSDLGFEYEYEEGVTGLEECFSSRLTLIPPGNGLLGTNGKGMSRGVQVFPV